MTDLGQELDPYIRHQIASRSRSAVIKIEFLSFRSRYPKGNIFIVEGIDDKIVYSYWIGRVYPSISYEFFVCNGKRGVRALRNSLFADRSSADNELIFLVDRDFDDLEGFECTESVFMLDRYSVENYLVERCVVDATLQAAFPGHSDPTNRNQICELFEKVYSDFLEASKEINRRIFLARKLKRDIDDSIPSSANCIAKIDLESLEPSGANFEEIICLTPEPSKEEICQFHEDFANLEPAERYRGKFALKFMLKWFELLANEYRNPSTSVFSPSKTEGTIKFDEIRLGALAFRSPIPDGFDKLLCNI